MLVRTRWWRGLLEGGAMAEKKRARILVVSDDEESGTIAQEILASRGYAVGRVTNADVTPERLDAGAPDLVVLDMFAPVLEAWPILDDIVRLAQPPAVVALTGRCVSPGALAALTQHIRGQLSKPFAPDALTGLCDRLLEPNAPARTPEAERRHEGRTTFVGEATLLTNKGRPVCAAHVLELSQDGARLEVGPLPETPFKVGSRIRLTLTLPPSFEARTLSALIEWREDRNMGVSFLPERPAARQAGQPKKSPRLVD
jgi:DNA-binding response OmpR family regulator